MKEIFKDIPSYEGLYQISNKGKIKTLKRERVKEGLKKTFINKNNNYTMVMLYKNGEGKNFYVHKLVAENFVSNSENKPIVDHIDRNKRNNKSYNLRWVTQKENHENMSTNKSVIQFDLFGNEIARYNTTKQATEATGCTHISEICRGKRKRYKNFTFKYAD